jgi:DNA topoisomerase-1
MELFELPRKLGTFKGQEVEANVGRYGPYVRYGKKFVSLGEGESAFDVDLERAIELIEEKEKAEAPITKYEGKDVTKGKGRFGPFIKWDNMFINVGRKYDFDNLSQEDIEELIEAKKKKESEKVVQEWADEGIRIEKARWGRHTIIKGRTKVELSKDVDATEISLDEVQALLEKKKPKKKTTKKTKG